MLVTCWKCANGKPDTTSTTGSKFNVESYPSRTISWQPVQHWPTFWFMSIVRRKTRRCGHSENREWAFVDTFGLLSFVRVHGEHTTCRDWCQRHVVFDHAPWMVKVTTRQHNAFLMMVSRSCAGLHGAHKQNIAVTGSPTMAIVM